MGEKPGVIIDADILIKVYRDNSVADNFIAATALFYSLEVYTDNKKHSTFIDGLSLFYPGR